MHKRSYTKVPALSNKRPTRTNSSEGILTSKTNTSQRQRSSSKEISQPRVKISRKGKIPSLPIKKITKNRNLEELFNLFRKPTQRYDFIDQEMDNLMGEVDEIIKFCIDLSRKYNTDIRETEYSDYLKTHKSSSEILDNSSISSGKMYHFAKSNESTNRKRNRMKTRTMSSKQLPAIEANNYSVIVQNGYHEELNKIEQISIPPLISKSYLSNRNMYIVYEMKKGRCYECAGTCKEKHDDSMLSRTSSKKNVKLERSFKMRKKPEISHNVYL
ncbi:unnamed protein product [Blepharisma stoltei]|uniref:Uncharacterized protein n=1 Tax=Blepharisma stoltei TaxID=1481888 RepID=A0AAU9IMH6_9CILI|nr:unnamed protein product [Blepharisma stoltei]